MQQQRADAEARREEARQPIETAHALFKQAEIAAGQALAAFRSAENEEQTLALQIESARRQLAQMEENAASRSWRP
jgi:hypothetical protein